MINWIRNHKMIVGGSLIATLLLWLLFRNSGGDGGAGAFSGVDYNDVPVGTSLLTFGSSGALNGGGKIAPVPAKGNVGGGGKSGGGVHVTGSNLNTKANGVGGNSDGLGGRNAPAVGGGGTGIISIGVAGGNIVIPPGIPVVKQ